jgi:hypothetical protein
MVAMIKVEFRQAFYSGDKYYNKGETYDLPADTPIPSRDVVILEGKSTFKPGSKGKSAPRVTKMQKDEAANLRRKQEAAVTKE